MTNYITLPNGRVLSYNGFKLHQLIFGAHDLIQKAKNERSERKLERKLKNVTDFEEREIIKLVHYTKALDALCKDEDVYGNRLTGWAYFFNRLLRKSPSFDLHMRVKEKRKQIREENKVVEEFNRNRAN